MNDMKIALAAVSLPNRSLDDALAIAARQEYEAICIFGATNMRHSGGLLPGFFWNELDNDERQKLKKSLSPFNAGAVHAPFQDLPLVSTNKYVEQEAIRQIVWSIQAASELNLEIVTVHASRPNRMPEAEVLSRAVNNLRILGDEAQKYGVRIGLENVIYPTDPDEYVELLDAIDHPAVGATLDTGHIAFWLKRDGITHLEGPTGAAFYNDCLARMIDQLGQRIIHLHVHDIRLPDVRDHRAVGRGIIDFGMLVQRLRALEFEGMLEFELEEPDDVQACADSRQCLLQWLQS
jgi:sugar phosphate isomerase/epimerase